jgi:hypothetical protein
MTVVDGEDRFWRNVSSKPFEEVKMNDDMRETLRQIAFVKPLPFVHRVVFISTPHRGSYLASWHLVRRLILSLVSLPKRLTTMTGALLSSDPAAFAGRNVSSVTSIDNMSPGNPFVKTLSGLPIAPGVTAHSIIPVKKPPIESGNDGVVEYSSAHIDGVESEKVILGSSHSTQDNPETIEEVRRILLEHAAAAPQCGGGP